MSRIYLKKAQKTASTDSGSVRDTVQSILDEIETGGEEARAALCGKIRPLRRQHHRHKRRDC